MTDLLAPSLAAAFLGSLAFVAFVMWLRGQKPQAHPLEERLRTLETLERSGRDAYRMLEEKRLKLSKRLGEVEFKVLGSRRTPAEDEKGTGGA